MPSRVRASGLHDNVGGERCGEARECTMQPTNQPPQDGQVHARLWSRHGYSSHVRAGHGTERLAYFEALPPDGTQVATFPSKRSLIANKWA